MEAMTRRVPRPRRFGRARFVVLGVALVVAAIAALAVAHAPHRVSLIDVSDSVGASAVTEAMTAGHLDHAGSAAALQDSPCAHCGGEQDGAALACALILLAMAIVRLLPRTTARVLAWVRRHWPASRWPAATQLPQAPSLHTLCISRT